MARYQYGKKIIIGPLRSEIRWPCTWRFKRLLSCLSKSAPMYTHNHFQSCNVYIKNIGERIPNSIVAAVCLKNKTGGENRLLAKVHLCTRGIWLQCSHNVSDESRKLSFFFFFIKYNRFCERRVVVSVIVQKKIAYIIIYFLRVNNFFFRDALYEKKKKPTKHKH